MNRHQLLGFLILALTLTASCGVFTSKPKELFTLPENGQLAEGQGAVLMHVINRRGLMATRWFRMDDPENSRISLTVFRTTRHRIPDRLDDYDLVMLPAGRYALYSVYTNCEEGIRPYSTDWDAHYYTTLATSLGQYVWDRNWTQYQDDWGPDWGFGGIFGGRGGLGLGIGMGGGLGGPSGLPVASCNLLSRGVDDQGQVMLASITVNPGEVVYAGELDLDAGPNQTCRTDGNWYIDGRTTIICGAEWMSLKVENAYESLAEPFLFRNLSPDLMDKVVVRLAEPGNMVQTLWK